MGAESSGSHFKMNPQSLLIHLFALYSVCHSQITLVDDQESRPVSGEDVDTRLFNINLGTLDLGNVAGTALGTTLGNLGTGFLQDCFGIGKRSIIMDQLVNRRRRNPQEVSDEVQMLTLESLEKMVSIHVFSALEAEVVEA